jgi:hypothetical protein
VSVRENDDPELYAKIQEQNLLRQYDLLSNCIEIGLKKGVEFFDKYTLWSLNYAAVSNISQFGGRYREEPIYVGNHIPPHFQDVPNLMDRFFSVVREKLDNYGPSNVAPGLCAVEAQLDSSVCRRQWKDRKSCLLLSDLLEAGSIAAWEENCA